MAVILHIETSGTTCSAALSAEGMILAHREEFGGRNHAALISDYVKHCLDHAASHEMELQAVAVSIGPGSYTGLRIGLSEAKGLAYALGVPLIGVHTLELMATTAMFEAAADDPDTIFIPMVDARRMEVYTAAYDYSLNSIVEPQAMILEEDSFATERASGRPLVFFGSGAAKAQPLFAGDSAARYVEGIEPLATGMLALAEKAWANRQFIDIAYSTPVYLKDFQATQPKHKGIMTETGSDFGSDLRAAAEVLRKGGVILYPTDTVWGIGCDARCGKAVERIFRIKQRADSKAMIVLVGDLGQLERTVNEVPEVAYDLIEFSERPLTIVYDGVSPASGIAPGLCAADGTIAVRLTRERFSAALCKALGAPLVSTSANISGQPAATCFYEISQEIIDAVDYVCITGRQATSAARPSTVMRLGADGIFKVLRP